MKAIKTWLASGSCIILSVLSTSSLASDEPLPLLPSEQVPQYIAEFKTEHQKLSLSYQGTQYHLKLVNISEEGLIVSFKRGVAILGFDFDKQQPTSLIEIYEGQFNLDELSEDSFDSATQIWESNDISIRESDNQISYQGMIENRQGSKTQVKVNINESLISAGSSRITVSGSKATLTGDLGTLTYLQIQKLLKTSPQVDTLVIAAVNGSLNDEINVHTGYLVRKAGLNTEIPQNGYAYSGGVDLLLSGVKRSVANNAEVGVHSWCCVDNQTAAELPQSHAAHQSLVDYSQAMLGYEKGKAFYFYTLKAAPFDDVHLMTRKEMKTYGVIN